VTGFDVLSAPSSIATYGDLLEHWHPELGFPRDGVVPRSGVPEVLAHALTRGHAARERLDEAPTTWFHPDEAIARGDGGGKKSRRLPNSDVEADGLPSWKVMARCLVGFAQGSGGSEHTRRAETSGPAA
jgi:hypothetical protein